MSEPLVSVFIITYNHATYIAQAIERAIKQETNFPFEIVVGEDCSTDGTHEIVLDYEKKCPNIIRVITSDNNVGGRENAFRTLKACRGKYIAICEGDDYWTDPQKLQKQVSFMIKHPNLSMSFHATNIEYVTPNKRSKIHRHKGRRFVNAKDVILGGGCFYMTCSSMFRRDVIEELLKCHITFPVGDAFVSLIAVSKGDVGYIDEIMATYRSGFLVLGHKETLRIVLWNK